MNKYEDFACGQVFHSYPESKSFQEICDLCECDDLREAFNENIKKTDDLELELCQRYENEWWENIPAILEELRDAAEHHFGADND